MLRLHPDGNVTRMAHRFGLRDQDLIPYGNSNSMCKVNLPFLTSESSNFSRERFMNRQGIWSSMKYVVVTAMNPTSYGEGKTTTALGLSMALNNKCGRKAVCCLRQPSLGPTFSSKGGAHGAGKSVVANAEALDLHLTGDTHAIVAAHNLIAAAVANRQYHENLCADDTKWLERICPDGRLSSSQIRRLQSLYGKSTKNLNQLNQEQQRNFARLEIDPSTVVWTRILDVCDRSLRKQNFEIAAASELMAILSLSTSFDDLYGRVGRIIVAYSARDGSPVTVDDLGVTGAVCALLRDAMFPTLMQTCEGTPVLVHTGPFANIAHGCNSVLADWLAASMVCSSTRFFSRGLGYVITEAGFGADVGFEKLCDIKARTSGLVPDCAVLVATVRALRLHGNNSIEQGAKTNLNHHIKTITKVFGVPVVVALNRHSSDSSSEISTIRQIALSSGASACVESSAFKHGSNGAKALAESVEDVVSRHCKSRQFKYSYDEDCSLHDKIESIAKRVYGAGRVEYSESAKHQLKELEKNETMKHMPVCIAKTPFSLTASPKIKGVPYGFTLPITRLLPRAGAGFITAYAGNVFTMPGMPARPRFIDVDFNTRTGSITGIAP